MSRGEACCRYLPDFLGTVLDEMGRAPLTNLLGKAGAPGEWSDPDHIRSLHGVEAARVFAGLQRALRIYYGRGARGSLIRTGRALWERLLGQAPLPLKVRAGVVRASPTHARLQPALGLLTGLLGVGSGDITIRRVERGLVLQDRASPTTLGQSEEYPICYVTLGMLQACTLWATGVESDVEETRCRACGEGACEFEIVYGG